MNYYHRALIGNMVISACVFLFSIIGIAIVALLSKIIFVLFAWLLTGVLTFSWDAVFHSMKIGGIGGGFLGIGIVLLRLFKVRGF